MHRSIFALFLIASIQLAPFSSGQALPSAPPPEQRPTLPADHFLIQSTTQEANGDLLTFLGRVRIFTDAAYFEADRVVRNTKTGAMEATGHVFYQNYEDGQKLACELAHYDPNTETGTFVHVVGESPSRIAAKPHVLVTKEPFHYEGETADRTVNADGTPRYVLHNGFVSDCRPDDLWWRLKASTFDIIPGDRAVARSSTMYLKNVPIFYFPWFRKPLDKQARASGFLTPHIGNSSSRGQSIGLGYFWAINRSYDASYRTVAYTKRGFVHEGDFEGWINSNTSFDVTAFGAGANKQLNLNGGYVITAQFKSDFGNGWQARGELHELSSLPFRQEFTSSFDEAINSETHSVAYLTRHWNDYGLNFVIERNVNFQTDQPGDTVITRKLPEAEFLLREHPLFHLPAWISFDSSAGLERRTQPLFQTRQFVERLDFAPRIMTAVHLFGIDLAPSVGAGETYYGSRLTAQGISGDDLVRSSRDVQLDIGLPRISRIFTPPAWLHAGDKVKHVMEVRARYRYVGGVDNFDETVRFDQTDLLANTNEVEFSLTNRLLQRDGNGGVSDLLSWELWYKRYFDPTFGGAILPGQRNVVDAATDITGYAFLDGSRRQSPIVSVLRIEGLLGAEWRTDYDPVRHSIVNSTVGIYYNRNNLHISANHSQLRTDPVLAPKANQIRVGFQYGDDQHHGWNYGFNTGYDYLQRTFQYLQAETTYNTNCCGFSVQYRRFNFNVINDNQFRLAFTIANIGSFGTLRRQERMF